MSSVLANANETSSLFLPTGSYTVAGSQAGNTESAQVGVTDGVASSVTLDFNALLSIEIILVVTAIMAAGANILVWVFRSRSLRSRVATKQAHGP